MGPRKPFIKPVFYLWNSIGGEQLFTCNSDYLYIIYVDKYCMHSIWSMWTHDKTGQGDGFGKWQVDLYRTLRGTQYRKRWQLSFLGTPFQIIFILLHKMWQASPIWLSQRVWHPELEFLWRGNLGKENFSFTLLPTHITNTMKYYNKL